ncbi:MAG TPA: diguanylate cyclase, partial [Candidatus Kapabacteria bacterium]|nr:diguanylate cyclase [Candidatus Kapabacteria bacterium]
TKENGLINNNITKIFIDKEKNIFVGTRWGMSQLSLDLFKMYDAADGLPHEFIWCFAEDEDNDSILIGSEAGIVELMKKDGKIHNLAINNQLKETPIRAIVKINAGNFFIGTRNRGIYHWNRQDKLKQIHPTAHVLSALKATDNNNNNIVWWGTDNGLLRHDLKNKTLETFQKGLKDKNIWSLALYDEETLLLGTGKGIQKFHKEKFVPFPLETFVGDATINDIKIVSKFETLVATQLNGLYIYRQDEDKREPNIIHLTTANGLTHNDVWSVIKDDTGNIWFNTSVSLDRYNNGFISHFNKKTGLYGNEGALHAVLKDKNGKIYFGIVPGFVEISPREESVDITPPILYIKQIIIDKNENSEVKEAILSSEITLPYRQNNAEFHYVAVSTRKENPVFYRIRLFPFEKQWSEPTRLTFVSYMNLPPGRYIFEVEANNGGEEVSWIKSQNTITLIIEKPFWLTWWFIGVSILSGIGLLGMFIKIRLRALENQKKYLEKLVKQRTEELARLSITDPLTDLKNRRYLEEKIKEDISLIERAIYDRIKAPVREPQTPALLLGIFILDIDYFKKVNDIYGHKAGDIVIVDIARLLLEMLRNSDTIVRWGGEEFLVITRQTGIDNSLELAERIRKRIAEYSFKINESIAINKTVSIGFAHFPFINNDIQTFHWTQVISLADGALYIAKNNGRNLTVGLKSGQRPLDIDAKEIISNIKMGIDKNYIELVSSKKNLKTPQPKS